MKHVMTVVFWSAVFLLASDSAHAYMDPGSGSLLLQILLAGFAGAAVGFRIFWKKIKSFFRLNNSPDTE